MEFVRTVVYYVIYPFVWLGFFLANPVFTVKGRENIPEGGYILCCNHSHAMDPGWVMLAVRPKKVFRFLAKKELRSVPVLGFLIECFGVVFVDRGNRDVAAMDKAREYLQGGDQMMIFPEGTRVKPGKSVPAKAGAIRLSAACGVPILPMYLTQDKRLFRPIRVVIGQPYYPVPVGEERSREEMKQLAAELMEQIYKLGEPVCK